MQKTPSFSSLHAQLYEFQFCLRLPPRFQTTAIFFILSKSSLTIIVLCALDIKTSPLFRIGPAADKDAITLQVRGAGGFSRSNASSLARIFCHFIVSAFPLFASASFFLFFLRPSSSSSGAGGGAGACAGAGAGPSSARVASGVGSSSPPPPPPFPPPPPPPPARAPALARTPDHCYPLPRASVPPRHPPPPHPRPPPAAPPPRLQAIATTASGTPRTRPRPEGYFSNITLSPLDALL
mmetsp:Transcript_4206/g.14402  ORF Transcript_4206/g.14402 Transcript_4206/m.14402 type:complete len:238 (+) Transcript_4206:933-1646(+)